ncbi:PilN domain-containing protein [Chitiniphilus purpureus]|uniref:PilN domain-containing protein n=1 Tax=Chitiniphilus purpureus TaxID=2981137 RepID=A0ABY6DP01_9NEIS|nr:PilN domain-containing protein [Chitiniphilus sp. CD1]UXY16107.1 PilN domain-containing protein [Chitiniphilus sp. CD1]
MIRINLLPHREQKRQARQRRYLAILGVAFAVAVGVVVAGWLVLSARVATQDERNLFLESENKKLDAEIAEIERLKAERAALLARKQVVERLQSNRAEAVRIMDQLVRQVPEGIYFSSVSQEGGKLRLVGYAQSNARVSTLMRSLNDSDIFELPVLIVVRATQQKNQRLSEFTLEVKIVRPDEKNADAQSVEKKG